MGQIIADYLGDGWLFSEEEGTDGYNEDPQRKMWKLVNSRNDRLTLKINGKTFQKLSHYYISGFVQSHDNQAVAWNVGVFNKDGIYCSKKKTAEQIAKDIKKRFLPDFLQACETYINKENVFIEQLAERSKYLEKLERLGTITDLSIDKCRFSLRVNGSNQSMNIAIHSSVNINKLDVTQDEFIALMEFLKNLRAETPKK